MGQVYRSGYDVESVTLWLSRTEIPKYRALDAVEIREIIKIVEVLSNDSNLEATST
jgi:hypothetical protein